MNLKFVQIVKNFQLMVHVKIVMNLKDNKVILRKLSEDDSLDNYLEFINDADHLIWIGWAGCVPMNKEDLKSYLRSNNNLFLGIFDHESRHVGNIQLGRLDYIHRNAEYGMVLDKREEGKGYAAAASRLILSHAFEILNLHRIYLSVAEQNKKAIRLYESLGFVQEGIEKEMHRLNFQYFDLVRYRMLEEDYISLKPNWK